MFENKVIRRIIRPTKNEVSGNLEWYATRKFVAHAGYLVLLE
jgi:hypothetical protein